MIPKEIIASMKKEYTGVFYERFILGKWVQAEGLIYSRFANGKSKYIIEKFPIHELQSIHIGFFKTIGYDIGEILLYKSSDDKYLIGIPIFTNSLEVLKSLDLTFDSFVNEIQNGRKRLFVTQDAMKVSSEF